ncbi:MAG: GC-type dockerin domain-anchored protein [Phycisphaerales bacterium JB040]
MANLGFSACSLSVFLAAVAGQAPCARAVLIEKELLVTNQLDAFGRTHTAMGNADLSLSPTGALVVSNIGSSGLDGVTFRLGDVRGHSMSIDMGDLAALAPGALVEVFHPYSWGGQTVFVGERNGGSAVMGIDGAGSGRRCVTVTVLDNGQPVASIDRIWDSRSEVWAARTDLVTGDFGSDPATGRGVSLSFEQIEWDYVTTMTLPTDTQLTLLGDPGEPAGAVAMGDQVRVMVHGLPPGEAPSDDLRVTASNLGRDLVISSEDIILPGLSRLQLPGVQDATYGLKAGPRVRALGSARVEGVPEADACQSHPKSWFFSTRLLDTTRAVQVDNLGSSGQDGVSFVYGGSGTPCGVGFTQCPDGSCVVDPSDCTTVPSDRVVYVGGKDTAHPDYLDMDSDDDGITLSATGSSGGSSGVHFGSVTLRNEIGGGNELDLYADFSSIGSDLVSVAVYDGGVFVGGFQQVVQPGVSLATLLPSPDGSDIDSFGKFVGGPPFGPPCFFFTTAAQFTLVGNGQVFVGDECRVLSAGNPTPIDFIATLDITGANLEPFDLRPASDADGVTGRGTVAHGVLAQAVGGAAVSTGADGALIVSNLGSSGEDGVALDLGDATASVVTYAGGTTFSFDTTIFITNAAYEPAQDRATPQELMTLQMTGLADDHVRLSPRSPDPTSTFTVTLRDRFGNTVAVYPMDQTQSLSVIDPSGVGVTLAGVSQRISDPEGGPNLCGSTPHFVSAGGGGGVDVLGPDGVLHQDVEFVDALMSNVNLDKCCRGHVIIMKRGATSGTRMPPEDLVIASLGKKGYDYYQARGDARLNIEVCDSSTGSDQFLTVANLGSSGEDGVSIDLSSQTCRIDSACCIDNDCDDEIDRVWVGVDQLTAQGGPGDLVVKFVVKKAPSGGQTSEIVFMFECEGTTLAGGSPGTTVGVSLNDSDLSAYEFLARVRVTDSDGDTLAVEEPGSYPSYLNDSPELVSIGAFTLEGTFEAEPTTSPSPTGRWWTNQKMKQSFVEPQDVTLLRSGQVVPNASGLEIEIVPVLASLAEFESFASLDVLFAAPAGGPGSLALSESSITRLPPPCPADVNNDGVLDNGDIGDFIALFLAQDLSVDFTGDGVVDNGDIGAFIIAFLAGCP